MSKLQNDRTARGGGRLLEVQKARWLAILAIVLVQTVVYTVAGMNKAYLHMDEAYSYGLANYAQIEIQDNADFYDQWHGGEYYEDYLAVNAEERGNLTPVYENQKNDVHPPLFYLLLRLGMEMVPGHFNAWVGLTLNILIFAINTVFVYLIIEKLMCGQKASFVKTVVLTAMLVLSVAAVDTVMYIRMYCLLTLLVTITVYLHMKLLEKTKVDYGWCGLIALVALLGVLTQYYYLFFLVGLYTFMSVRYIKQKRWQEWVGYTVSLVGAGIVSLVIWPYSLQHMFFGYRGQGAMSNLTNPAAMIMHIGIYLWLVSQNALNGLLPVIIIAVVVLCVRGMRRQRKLTLTRNEQQILPMIFYPTLVYFLLAAVMSPYQDVRYVMPICGMAGLLVLYGFYKIVNVTWQGERQKWILIGCIVVFGATPIATQNYPEMMYLNRTEIVAQLEEKTDLPTVYVFNSGDNRFLDDILLFSKMKQSYIAKDVVITPEKVRQILQGKNTMEGLVIFINSGQENEQILQTFAKTERLAEITHLSRLNACDVYYLHN